MYIHNWIFYTFTDRTRETSALLHYLHATILIDTRAHVFHIYRR